MFRGLVIGILLAVVLGAGGVWFYFATGRAPVGVTEPPMPFEKKLAKAALDARIKKDGPKESLVPADEANFLAAADVYKENCAVCHGLPGQEKTTIAQGMYPDPPQLFHGTGVTDDPAWETHWKAENGIRMTGMPGFKGRLTDKQLWQVSQLLANADKISPAVRVALSNAPAAPAAAAPAAAEKETKKKQ
jgi:mono/diheme cytochrome c family protein